MPARHLAPRHKASRSLGRSLIGLAAEALPVTGAAGAAALVGVAGIAAGVGTPPLDAGASTAQSSTAVAGPSGSVDASTHRGERAAPGQETERMEGRAASGEEQVSRSSTRPVLVAVQRETKHEAMSVSDQSVAGRVVRSVAPADPREIAMMMLPRYGWDSTQYPCLDQLYISESDWDPSATNQSSGAYGIPQSLPAEKMATAGADWRTNPATQIEWGLDYIRSSYGTPCSAWAFKQTNNWY